MNPLIWVVAGIFLLIVFCIATNIFGNWHGGGHRWPKWLP